MIGTILIAGIGYGIAVQFLISGLMSLHRAVKGPLSNRHNERGAGLIKLALAFLAAVVTRSQLGGFL